MSEPRASARADTPSPEPRASARADSPCPRRASVLESPARKGEGALTEEQRQRVRENLGLEAVHLRRHESNLAQPRRDREWDDLFQEGCLGLVQAAVTFDPGRGIPFAAYALARIHGAVSKALHTRFSTVRIPPPRRSTRAADTRLDAGHNPRPGVVQLGDEAARRLPERRAAAHDPGCSETIGTRLRAKYERALRVAGTRLARGVSTRGDRDRLIAVLIEQRLLVPAEEARTPLRQIARETCSSYARVAQCEKQLAAAVRAELEVDPEFVALRAWSRAESAGVDLVVDEECEQQLVQAGWAKFRQRYESASSSEQAAMVHALLQVSRCGIVELAATCYAGLAPDEREQLVRHAQPPPAESRKRRAG